MHILLIFKWRAEFTVAAYEALKDQGAWKDGPVIFFRTVLNHKAQWTTSLDVIKKNVRDLRLLPQYKSSPCAVCSSVILLNDNDACHDLPLEIILMNWFLDNPPNSLEDSLEASGFTFFRP